MGGFDSTELPDWMRREFDELTALPHGPLEHLPIPVDGVVTAGRSSAPSNGDPPRWSVVAHCAEPISTIVDFYAEYLPLSGYEVVVRGEFGRRRLSRDGRGKADLLSNTRSHVYVVRRGEFIGGVIIEPVVDESDSPSEEQAVELARVTADMARDDHPCMRWLLTAESRSAERGITWY